MGACTGLVRGPDGRPLAGAEVVAFPHAPTDSVVGAEGLAPRRAPVHTATDPTGEFRLTLGAAATLLIRHETGLGLTVPVVGPGDALRLLARPLAEIVLPDRSRGVHLLARGDDGDLDLGFWPGAHLRLPAGTYRLLIEGEAGRAELQVNARAGERQAVPAPATEAWKIRLPTDADVHAVCVDGWRGVPLTPTPDGALTLWPAASAETARLLAIATRGPHGALRWQRVIVAADDAAPTLERTVWKTWHVPAATAIVTLRPRAGGALEGVAWSAVVEGRAGVPVAPDASYVALYADGGLLAAAEDSARGALEVGSLTVLVHDAERPVVGASVELDGPAPQCRRRARTDSRGLATFQGVPRSRAFARLVHDDLCSDDLELTAATMAGHPHRLRARPGAILEGRVSVVGAADAPLAAVEVTLRDPTGADGLPTRRAPVTPAGTFEFRGLDADRRYTLFASLRRGSATFSAKLHGASTEAPVLLTLRSEDPPPPGHGR